MSDKEMREQSYEEYLERKKLAPKLPNPLNPFMETQQEKERMILVEEQLARLRQELEDTVEYLSWFHQEADFGPSHSDVVIWLQNKYEKETGNKVPEGWDYRIEEEEEYIPMDPVSYLDEEDKEYITNETEWEEEE